MIPVAFLPAVNAALNGASALLLTAGYLFIRHKKIKAHRACMLGAFGLSALFLISYLTYHFQAGATPFPGQGWSRPVYYSILVSHVFLAATMVPLVLSTLHRALKRRYVVHRRLARRTLPLWLYVSVTGVLIYLMLYQLFDAPIRIAGSGG